MRCWSSQKDSLWFDFFLFGNTKEGQQISRRRRRGAGERRKRKREISFCRRMCLGSFVFGRYLNDNRPFDCVYPFQMFGHFDTKQKEICLTDSWIDATKSLNHWYCLGLCLCLRSTALIRVMSVWVFDVQNFRIIF